MFVERAIRHSEIYNESRIALTLSRAAIIIAFIPRGQEFDGRDIGA